MYVLLTACRSHLQISFRFRFPQLFAFAMIAGLSFTSSLQLQQNRWSVNPRASEAIESQGIQGCRWLQFIVQSIGDYLENEAVYRAVVAIDHS